MLLFCASLFNVGSISCFLVCCLLSHCAFRECLCPDFPCYTSSFLVLFTSALPPTSLSSGGQAPCCPLVLPICVSHFRFLLEQDMKALYKFSLEMPYYPFLVSALNSTILHTLKGHTNVHIVDFTFWRGQWGPLVSTLAAAHASSGSQRQLSIM